MKFKLLAIPAAVLVSTAAYAQSGVTLYGVADVGIEYVSKAGPRGNSHTQMQSGGLSGSRWGLRGAEDLGGGLKAVFTLESGFSLDTGAATSRLFNRQSFVGMQGKFGTVTLGRHQTPLYDFGVAFDPMGLSRYSLGTLDSGMSGRADNSVKYTGKFGGLSASALYSFGYDTVNGIGEQAGNEKLGREYAASVGYTAGRFSVGAAYDGYQRDTATDAVVQRASVAGTYAAGPAKLFAGYRWGKVSSTAATSSASNVYWGGATYNVTPALALTGAAYYEDFRKTKADPWLFVALADYSLSKRTDVYVQAAYAMNRSDGAVSSAVTVDGINPGAYGTKGFNAFTSGEKTSQFGAMVGVRHRF